MSLYLSVGGWGGLLSVSLGAAGLRLVLGWVALGLVRADVDAVLGEAATSQPRNRATGEAGR